MFAAGRKAAADCSSQSVRAGVEVGRSRQQDGDWLSGGKSFSSGTGDEKAHATESPGSVLQVYKHRHSKHRHKEKKKDREEKQKSLAATSRKSRHLSKHKKKSKDKKRKRSRSRSDSSDDDRDYHSSHRSPRRRRRSRSNPRSRARSQSPRHKEGKRIITDTTKEIALREGVAADGEGKIFEFDCVGDRNNQFFGSTYVHDRPLYELATRRNFLTGNWISHKQPTYATPKRQAERKDSNRYFSLEARKAEKDARQKRLYIAYSERRSARAAANEDLGHSQDNQAGSRVFSRPPEMNFIPLDPVVDVSWLEGGVMGEGRNYSLAVSDDDKGILLSDGQSVEQYLVQRNKLLNTAVAVSPQDIDAWLDLMVFQEHTMRLFHTKTKKMNLVMKASVEDKQAAILAKALASNPQSRELHRVKLNMSLQSQASDDHDSFHLQLESLLTEDLTNSELWIKLLQSRQQYFGSFSMQSIRDLYARILSVMRAEHENVANGATAPAKSPLSATDLKGMTGIESRDPSLEKLSLLLLDIHFLMCVFEKKAGFVERSIAQIQALIDFSINDCAGSTRSGSTGAHLDLLQKFAVRWNDESTVGFGGEGWKNFTSVDCTYEDDPPHFSASEFEEYIQTTCVTTLDQVNPPEILRTKEHKQSLLCASAKYKRKSRVKGGTKSDIFGERSSDLGSRLADFDASDDSEIESRTGGKLIYSNLHGYRISVDNADDTKEYERILGELRGTETARTRQDQLLEKEKMKRAMLVDTESEVEDQRANYDMIEEGDRFVKWLMHEEVQTALQWVPLRSSNPLHHELIELQPDRAILTEEIQPFLFPVLAANQWRLIAELLHMCGVKWCGEYAWENNLQVCQSMYADDATDFELLVAPILSVLDPQAFYSKKQTLFLKPHDRKGLLQSALLDDVAVEQRVLRDPNKVSFVRRTFMRALGVFYNADKDLASMLKCLWISFEAEVIRTVGGEEANLVYARRLSQRLAQKTSNVDTDYGVLYAYAKLELKLGNERQVRRICESTLTAIGTPLSSNAAMARHFHRFVFLHARLEMWPSTDEMNQSAALTRDQERLRILRCLHTLRDVWRPDCKEKETLDAITKKHRKQTRAFLEEQLMSDRSIGASLIARYRTELGIAIRQCVQVTPRGCEGHTTSDRSQSRTTCWAGYCVHNLALVVYAFRGLEAACHEYRQALVNTKHHSCSHQAWLWTCFLEFMQQHQASGFFPVVAPRAWRSSVSQAVEKFPNNALFLRLFVDAETGNTISQVLRNYFLRVEKRWQRYYDSPELVEWLFALLCEISRVERAAIIKDLSDTAQSSSNKPSRQLCCLFHRWGMNATAVGRIRQMFESMVNHIRTKGNALCWRLYMRFEVALGKVDAAKKILYRGIAACAWSKALYMDGLRMLRVYLSEDECQELFGFMEAKELNIRSDLE